VGSGDFDGSIAQRKSELTITSMQSDVTHIKENVDRLMLESRTATEAILRRLAANGTD
jgi:hypothetical protein